VPKPLQKTCFFVEVLALSEVLFEVLFFSFITKEHQHQGTPTPIDPSIDIDCDVLPATAIVHVVAVAVVTAADLALSLLPSPP
jgi:hypothetical protein